MLVEKKGHALNVAKFYWQLWFICMNLFSQLLIEIKPKVLMIKNLSSFATDLVGILITKDFPKREHWLYDLSPWSCYHFNQVTRLKEKLAKWESIPLCHPLLIYQAFIIIVNNAFYSFRLWRHECILFFVKHTKEI